jgi:hypothetical protein
MKTIWIPVMLAASLSGAHRQERDLVVYLHHDAKDAGVVTIAELQAQNMLARVGISVEWRLGTPARRGNAEVIEAVLSPATDKDFRPGALAFATLGPHHGTRIVVFFDRVRNSTTALMLSSVLAHVLVHEITHVLEGVSRHSETGVMKAHWEPADLREMRSQPLPFAQEDVRLINEWGARHQRTLIAGAR